MKLIARKGLTYPVGASVDLINEAGGIRNLTEEQRASLTMKRVAPGDRCDDVPTTDPTGGNPRDAFLASGAIQEIKPKKKKGSK